MSVVVSEMAFPFAEYETRVERTRGAVFLPLAHLDAAFVRRRFPTIAELCRRLARSRMPLTVCPLSNIRLAVFERMEQHNLKRLLDSGLCVTVNSDDPAYFGGYVLENYLAVQGALGLTRSDLTQLARNSIEASFLPAAEKQSAGARRVRWNRGSATVRPGDRR